MKGVFFIIPIILGIFVSYIIFLRPYPGATSFTKKILSSRLPSGRSGEVLGDVNGDGKVDGIDYTVLLTNYGKSASGGASVGDFNNDGIIDDIDMRLYMNNLTL
jgi:hypothetical protein